MADETLKKLLIKLGIDTKDWKVAVNEIKNQLNAVNTQAKSDAAAMKTSQKEQIDLTRQQIADQQRLTAEAKSMVAVDQAKAAWEKKNQEIIQTKIKQRILETTEIKKQQVQAENAFKLTQQQVQLEQKKLQLHIQQTKEQERQLRLQTTGNAEGGGGVLGSIGKFASGLAGGGMLGNIFGGALLGGGVVEIMSKLAEKVHELGEALLEASGPAQTLRAEFERLSERKGVDPTELLEKLRTSTRGLVSDVELFKVANNFLKSNMKVTTDQMQLLIQNTINLGRSMGKTGPEVAHALEVAFLNPQRGMMQLARVTGISREVLMNALKGLPPTIDPATRATIMFTHVLAEEEKMLKKVGVAATTLPELLTQLHTVESNFVDEMAHGILTGSGFGSTINEISKRLIEMGPRLDTIAKNIGEKLAGALKFVVDHFNDIKSVAEGLILIKVGMWAVEGTTALLNMGAAAIETAKSLTLIKAAEEGIAAARLARGEISTEVALENAAEGAGGAVGGIAATLATLIPMVVTAVVAYLGIKWATTAQEENARPTTVAEDQSKVITGYVRGTPIYGQAQRRTPVYTDAELQQQALDAGTAVARKPVTRVDTGDNKKSKEDEDKAADSAIIAKKLAQQRLQLAQILDKTLLDETKQRIASEEAALKDQYEEGLIALQDYIFREKSLKAEEHDAALKRLRDDLEAQLQHLAVGEKITIDGVQYDVENKAIAAQAKQILIKKEHDAELEEETKYNSTIHGLDRQLMQDRQSAYRTYVDAINKVNKAGVDERTSVLETEFKQGNVGADAYLSERRSLITEELTLTLQGLEDKKNAAKNNANELAKIDADEVEARIGADKKLTAIDLQQNQIRLQALEAHYDKAKKYLEVEQTIAKSTPGGDTTQRELTTAKELYSITSQYIAQQKILLSQQEQGSKAWIDIAEHIATATEEENKLNLQMAQLKDMAGPLGGLFGSIAGLLGQFRHTSGIVELLGKMESSMEKLSKFSIDVNKMGGGANYFKDLGSSVANVFRKGGGQSQTGKTAQQIFDEALGKSSDTMSEMDKQTFSTAKALAELQSRAEALFSAMHQGTANVPLQSAQNKASGFGSIAQYIQPFGTRTESNIPSNYVEKVQSFQFGGTVPETGLVHAHQGEEIITPGQVGLLNQFISGVSKFGNAIESVVAKIISVGSTIDQHKTSVFTAPVTSTVTKSESLIPQVPQFSFSQLKAPPSIFSGSMDSQVQRLSPMAQEKEASFTPGGFGGNDPFSSLTASITSAVDGIRTLGISADSTANKLKGVKGGDELPGGGMASGDDDDDDGSGGGGGGAIQGMMGKMQSLIGGVTGLVQGLTAGKNASGGALSGGMAGMQFGAAFGPIGAAAGLVGGAGLGAIFGNKEAHLTADLKQVQNQMQSIIDSMNAGTISLSQTIADLRTERQSAMQLLTTGKGGGKGGKSKKGQPSQIQQAIATIDQQIAQLVNEQQQILQNLTSSLITLSQPLQFQQYLQSLNQIISQYQQFASAAVGNTQEVANANDFLNLSLQNYVTTLSQNLNQAQQTAIQDALTLINLEYQRQQLMNQTAQQEYDILTQGVLTRQRTTAMTKGQEIGQIEYQAQIQMEQMNEEIALNQAKVAAETKIFGLATTRIGLENQLLAAQEEQANYQIAQVLALSQVVQDLTSGLSSGQIMTQLTALTAGGAMPTGSGLLMLLAQILGLGGNVPGGVTGGQYGTQNWLEQIPQSYQSAAQYVAQQNPNFYTDFEGAAGSAPGSPQRQAAIADVQPLLAQGKIEGFDMQDFLTWLQSGSIPTLASLQTGGPVEETGPILAHSGEYMLNASDVSTLKTLLTGIQNTSGLDTNNLSPVITNLTDAVTILANGLTNNMATESLGTSNRPGGGLVNSAVSGITQLGTVITNAMVAAFKTIPSFQSGGVVPGSGPQPIIAHGGEVITNPTGTSSAGVNTSALAVTAQTTLLSLTKQRASLENNVISARQQQIRMEIQLLQGWQDMFAQIQSMNVTGANSGATNLEALFQKVTETRGRYGSGAFRGQSPL